MLRQGISLIVYHEKGTSSQSYIAVECCIFTLVIIKNQTEISLPRKDDHLNLQETIIPNDQLLHELVGEIIKFR